MEPGEDFTIVCAGFEPEDAEATCAMLREAGVDARVVDCDPIADGIWPPEAPYRRDVAVPSAQERQAMALLGIMPEAEPPPYQPPTAVAAFPVMLIGALMLGAAVLVPICLLLGGRDPDDVGVISAILAVVGIIGLMLIFGPILSSARAPRTRTAAPPRSRIVS